MGESRRERPDVVQLRREIVEAVAANWPIEAVSPERGHDLIADLMEALAKFVGVDPGVDRTPADTETPHAGERVQATYSPHATDHRLDCTGSNEAGQPGSNYGVPAGGPGPGEMTPTMRTAVNGLLAHLVETAPTSSRGDSETAPAGQATEDTEEGQR